MKSVLNFKWKPTLRSFFNLMGKMSKEVERSSRNGQELTEYEKTYISSSRGKCPDCVKGELLEGPQGGGSINYLCNYCGSKYNIGWPWAQRISDSSLYDEQWESLKTLSRIYKLTEL